MYEPGQTAESPLLSEVEARHLEKLCYENLLLKAQAHKKGQGPEPSPEDFAKWKAAIETRLVVTDSTNRPY